MHINDAYIFIATGLSFLGVYIIAYLDISDDMIPVLLGLTGCLSLFSAVITPRFLNIQLRRPIIYKIWGLVLAFIGLLPLISITLSLLVSL